MVSLDGPWGRFEEPTYAWWLVGVLEYILLLLYAIQIFLPIFIRTFIVSSSKGLEGTLIGFSRQFVVEVLQLIDKQLVLLLLSTLTCNLIADSWFWSFLSHLTRVAVFLKLNVLTRMTKAEYFAEVPTPQARVRKRNLLKIETRISTYVSASTADRLLSDFIANGSDTAGLTHIKKARFGQRGDLSLLRCNQPQDVDLEGIPSLSSCKDVTEFLLAIDPDLDFASGATEIRVLPAALLSNGRKASTTKAIVTNLLMTSHLKRFIECGDSSGKVPPSMYIRRYFRTDHRLEIPASKKLKHVIETLENAGWMKREIESCLLEIFGNSLQLSEASKTAVTLRINVTRFEGAGKVMRRLPCSQGRILLLFNDAESVADIVAGMQSAVSAETEKPAVFPFPTTDGWQGISVKGDDGDTTCDKTGDYRCVDITVGSDGTISFASAEGIIVDGCCSNCGEIHTDGCSNGLDEAACTCGDGGCVADCSDGVSDSCDGCDGGFLTVTAGFLDAGGTSGDNGIGYIDFCSAECKSDDSRGGIYDASDGGSGGGGNDIFVCVAESAGSVSDGGRGGVGCNCVNCTMGGSSCCSNTCLCGGGGSIDGGGDGGDDSGDNIGDGESACGFEDAGMDHDGDRGDRSWSGADGAFDAGEAGSGRASGGGCSYAKNTNGYDIHVCTDCDGCCDAEDAGVDSSGVISGGARFGTEGARGGRNNGVSRAVGLLDARGASQDSVDGGCSWCDAECVGEGDIFFGVKGASGDDDGSRNSSYPYDAKRTSCDRGQCESCSGDAGGSCCSANGESGTCGTRIGGCVGCDSSTMGPRGDAGVCCCCSSKGASADGDGVHDGGGDCCGINGPIDDDSYYCGTVGERGDSCGGVSDWALGYCVAEGAGCESGGYCYVNEACGDSGGGGCDGGDVGGGSVGVGGGSSAARGELGNTCGFERVFCGAKCASGDGGSCGYDVCFGVEGAALSTGGSCDRSGVAEFVVIGNGSIGGVLFCAEGAGGCEAVAELLREQAAAALLVAVAVAVTGRMALAALDEVSPAAAVTLVPAREGRLGEQAAADDFSAPKPLSGPTRKLWSRWTDRGVVLKSRHMPGGLSAFWSTFSYCFMQFRYFGRCSDIQLWCGD